MTSQPLPQNPSDDIPKDPPTVDTQDKPIGVTTARDAYNLVSDTVSGVNIRKSDNMFQLKVIMVCMLLGATIGGIVGALLSDADSRLVSALAGCLSLGFLGVVLGLFGSGIYLMIYRAVRHFKGKHD